MAVDNGGGGGPGPLRGGAAALVTGIHIALVIIADVNNLVAALGSAGQALHTGVHGGAVACKGHHIDLAADALIVQLDAGQHGGDIIQQGEEHGALGTGLLVPAHNADTAHASGRHCENGVGAHDLHAGAQGQLNIAAHTGRDARRDLIFIGREFFNNIHLSALLTFSSLRDSAKPCRVSRPCRPGQ